MKKSLVADVPGLRLDRFLAERLEGYSRGAAQALIERGLVRVDGKQGHADHKLREGALVEISESRADWGLGEGVDDWLVHEDKALLVLVKPAGLLMHPLGETWLSAPEAALSERDPNLAGLLYKRFGGKLPAGLERCGIVHRLDRQTSGLLVVAKTAKAQAALISSFKEREIDKTYRAIVRGVPADAKARVDAPIGRKPGHRKVGVTPFGKMAQTALRVIETAPAHGLVEAKPLTGRTHQIRAHLALVGHPVAGDPEFEAPDARPKAPRLMLHAFRLAFDHPSGGKRAEFKAVPPKDFQAFWRLCKAGK